MKAGLTPFGKSYSDRELPIVPGLLKQVHASAPGRLDTVVKSVAEVTFDDVKDRLNQPHVQRVFSLYFADLGHYDSVHLLQFVADAPRYMESAERFSMLYLTVQSELPDMQVCARGLYRLAGSPALEAALEPRASGLTRDKVMAVAAAALEVLRSRYFNREKPRTYFPESKHAQMLLVDPLVSSRSASSRDLTALLKLESVMPVPDLPATELRRMVRRCICVPKAGDLIQATRYWKAKQAQFFVYALRSTSQWRTLRLKVDTLQQRLATFPGSVEKLLFAEVESFAQFLDFGKVERASWERHSQALSKDVQKSLFGKIGSVAFLESLFTHPLVEVVQREIQDVQLELLPRTFNLRLADIGAVAKTCALTAEDQSLLYEVTFPNLIRHIHNGTSLCLPGSFKIDDIECAVEGATPYHFFKSVGNALLEKRLFTKGDVRLAAATLATSPEVASVPDFRANVFYWQLLSATTIIAHQVIDNAMRYRLCPGLLDRTGPVKAWRNSTGTSYSIRKNDQEPHFDVMSNIGYDVFACGQEGDRTQPIAKFDVECVFMVSHSGNWCPSVQLRPHTVRLLGIEQNSDFYEALLGGLEGFRI